VNSGLNSFFDLNESQPYLENIPNFSDQLGVSVLTLDNVITENLNNDDNTIKILKIDTQGYELNVLKSGSSSLKQGYFDIVLIELILVNKYIDMPHWLDTLTYLYELGFFVIDLKPFWRELNNLKVSYYEFGQFTEVDLLLVHKESSLVKKWGLKI
jgi:hypothetical protein